MRAALGRALADTFAGVDPHLPADAVREAFAAAQGAGVDGVVTMGGGSVVECGKAVAFFVEQQAGTPGQSVLDRPAVVHVAVPTTYTPAVLTGAFTMTDPHTRTKAMTGTFTSAPTAVLYDPDLLAALGPATVAGTAFDALAAAIGGTHRAGRSPETEAIAHAASARIAGALPLLIDVPDEDLLRAEVLQAAALAARVLQRTGPGPHQALAQLVGGRTGAPHGVVSAILLPHTVAERPPPTRAPSAGWPRSWVATTSAVVLTELLERVGLPAGLGALGIGQDDLDAVARMSQAHPGLAAATARDQWTEDEVAALLAGAR